MDQDKKVVIRGYIGLILPDVKVYQIKLTLVLWSFLGNSGKTQILSPVGELLGTDKITNTPIQQVSKVSKFALGNTIGKRPISIGGQTGSEVRDSSVFK